MSRVEECLKSFSLTLPEKDRVALRTAADPVAHAGQLLAGVQGAKNHVRAQLVEKQKGYDVAVRQEPVAPPAEAQPAAAEPAAEAQPAAAEPTLRQELEPVGGINIAAIPGDEQTFFQLDKQKWEKETDQTEEIFKAVNMRLKRELDVLDVLLGPVQGTRELPLPQGERGRSVFARDLGKALQKANDDGWLSRLMDESEKPADLAKELGYKGKAASEFAKYVQELRRTDTPILSDNGKAGGSVDLLLATCQPTKPCKECYAAKAMWRYETVFKAARNTIRILVDPKTFGKAVAEEAKKRSKAKLPFIRMLGSGDLGFSEVVTAFNEIAKHADRPIHIFSRHHDNLAKLKGTQAAPFLKMGSIDIDLYHHYGPEFLKENMEKRGINNAWLYTSPNEIPALMDLFAAKQLGLILSASHALHASLPENLRIQSCPCDAGERSLAGSCGQCAASAAGCMMMFADKVIDTNGKVHLLDELEGRKAEPILSFIQGYVPRREEKNAPNWQAAAFMHRFVEVIQYAKTKLGQDVKKYEKGETPYVRLMDVRFPGDVIRIYDKKALAEKEAKKAAKAAAKGKKPRIDAIDVEAAADAADLADGSVAYVTRDELIARAKAHEERLEGMIKKAQKEGTFYLPGGEVQPPVAYKAWTKIDARQIPLDAAKGLMFQSKLGFYSALSQAVEAMDFKAMPAADLLNRLKGAQQKGAFKQEEMDDLGLADWLAGQEGKVTKEQVLAFIEQGGPQLEEVTKGEAPGFYSADERWGGEPVTFATEEEAITSAMRWWNLGREEAEQFVNETADRAPADASADTKFGSYTLPGGENYREVLLTLSNAGDGPANYVPGLGTVTRPHPDAVKAPAFKSSHWDEPNVLAHFRLNDRTGPNGEKVLFIEEIQSDWHQKGRSEGYAKQPTDAEKAAYFRKKFVEDRYYSADEMAEMSDAEVLRAAIEESTFDHFQDIASGVNGVPNAPFKKTETWAMLAFKRVLRMAAEQGYDSVAWTSGEIQAERYDLSKQVDSVVYFPNENGTVDIQVAKGGNVIHRENAASKEKTADLLGKELAEKIFSGSGEPNGEGKTLSGLDLKVGGEGMKGFYDQMLPKAVQKYVGKLDKTAKVAPATFGNRLSEAELTALKTDAEYLRRALVAARGNNAEHARLNQELVAVQQKLDAQENVVDIWSLPITETLRAKALEGQTLYQEKTDPRGAIQLSDEETVIKVFRAGDVSTIIHEIGHMYLSFITEAVQNGTATPEIQGMHNTLLEYAGGTWTRESIEKTMNAFEAYWMRGKAPAPALIEPFRRLRKWFIQLYVDVQKFLGGNLPPDVRDVFDHWLAADHEIEEAKAYYAANKAVSDLIQEDIVDDEVTKANKAWLKENRDKVEVDADDSLEKDAAERVNAWLRITGGRKALRAKVAAEVADLPVYKVLAILRDHVLIDAKELDYFHGEGTADALAKRHGDFFATDDQRPQGAELDSIAKANGFASDREFVAEALKAPPYRETVNARYDEVLEEKRVEFRAELQGREATVGDAALHQDASLDFLWADLAVMSSKLKQRSSRRAAEAEKQALRDKVREQLYSRKSVREAVRYDLAAKAEARHAKLAMAHAEKGDWENAYIERRKQIYYHTVVLESVKIREESEAIRRRYKASSLKLDKVELEYRTAVLDLVSSYRLNKTTPPPKGAVENAILLPGKGLDPKADEDLLALLPEWTSLIPEWLLGKTVPPGYRDFTDLTFDQLRDLDGTVKMLIQRGRGELKALKEERAATIAELAGASMATMQALPNHYTKQPVGETPKTDDRSLKGRLYSKLDKVHAMLVQPQFLFELADGSPLLNKQPLGVLHKVFQKAGAAEDEFESRKKKLLDSGLKPAFETLISEQQRLERKYGGATFEIPGVPVPAVLQERRGRSTWDVDMLFSVLLNRGNDANTLALKNSEYQFSDAQLRILENQLSTQGWQAIQQVWTTINTLYPELNDVVKRLTNREVPKEAAVPLTVTTADGQQLTLEGGYYPLLFDPLVSGQVAEWKDAEMVIEQARREAVYRGSTRPRSGMTKARVRDEATGEYKGSKPPLLSVSAVLLPHLNDTLRLITHAEMLQELDALTRQEEWKSMFIDKFGRNTYAEIRKWINYQARPERKVTDPLSKALDGWRNLATISGMGFRFFSGVIQRNAVFNTVEAMDKAGGDGLKYLLQGFKTVGWKGGVTGVQTQEILDFVNARSKHMANRYETRSFDREARDLTAKLSVLKRPIEIGGVKITQKALQDAAFWWVQVNDASVVYPAWIGSYQQALAKKLNGIKDGMPQEEQERLAAEYADTIVQMSQAVARPADQAGAQRAEGPIRLLLMFMTWRIRAGNRLMWYGKAVHADQVDEKALMRHFAMEWMLPAASMLLLPAMLYGEKDRPRWWNFLLNPAIDATTWVPLVGDFARGAQYGPQFVGDLPAMEGIKRASGAAFALQKGNGWKAVGEIGRTLEWFAGFPVSNIPTDLLKKLEKTAGEE